MTPKAIIFNINDEKLKDTVSKICDILDASPLDVNECKAALCVILAMQGLDLAKKGLDPHIYARTVAMNIEQIMQDLKK